MKQPLLTIIIILAIAATGYAQKKKQKEKSGNDTILQLYDGPALPAEKVVQLTCPPEGKKYAYFITVDSVTIPNRSLTHGPQAIALLPGDHTLQVRFVSPGEIAIPVEPFDSFSFEGGKSYLVKFEYTPGTGGYLNSANTTRIRLWLEEAGKGQVLIEKIVNGFGRSDQ